MGQLVLPTSCDSVASWSIVALKRATMTWLQPCGNTSRSCACGRTNPLFLSALVLWTYYRESMREQLSHSIVPSAWIQWMIMLSESNQIITPLAIYRKNKRISGERPTNVYGCGRDILCGTDCILAVKSRHIVQVCVENPQQCEFKRNDIFGN